MHHSQEANEGRANRRKADWSLVREDPIAQLLHIGLRLRANRRPMGRPFLAHAVIVLADHAQGEDGENLGKGVATLLIRRRFHTDFLVGQVIATRC
jgi:hypothetical protein